MILVDTSAWVEHLRHGLFRLATLLEEGEVLFHPWLAESARVTVVMLPVSPPRSGQSWPPAAWPGHSAQPYQFLLELLQLLLEVLNAEVLHRRHAHLADGIEAPALGFDRIMCGRLAQAGEGHGHRFAAVGGALGAERHQIGMAKLGLKTNSCSGKRHRR